jgi:hypothetical protein
MPGLRRAIAGFVWTLVALGASPHLIAQERQPPPRDPTAKEVRYPRRSATIGSMRDARCAGRYAATLAMISSRPALAA